MSKVLALCLDDGHGQETAGKRSNLTGMRENTFNRAVVGYMKTMCEKNGILYKEVAPGDTDVPLETRAKTANDWYASLQKQYGNDLICWYLSIHANAGGGYGTEVWVHSTAIKEIQEVAGKVCTAVSALTGKNRGVKKGYPGDSSANFYVNRATNMYSMLIEHAFMDTEKDAKLLMEESFRKNCAAADLQAICDYYGIPFDGEAEQDTAPQPEPEPPKPSLPTYSYTTGEYEIICNSLNVRTGPGTSYSKKSFSQLTQSAQDQDGYKKGVVFTAKEVKNLPGESWARTPSGWVCLQNQDGTYVKKYTAPAVPTYSYTTGNYKVICDDRLNVRTGPGKGYPVKSLSRLTDSARKQGGYKKGVIFTAKEVRNLPGESWARTPSGWVCLRNQDGTYCQKV